MYLSLTANFSLHNQHSFAALKNMEFDLDILQVLISLGKESRAGKMPICSYYISIFCFKSYIHLSVTYLSSFPSTVPLTFLSFLTWFCRLVQDILSLYCMAYLMCILLIFSFCTSQISGRKNTEAPSLCCRCLRFDS